MQFGGILHYITTKMIFLYLYLNVQHRSQLIIAAVTLIAASKINQMRNP